MKRVVYCCEKQTIHDLRIINLLEVDYKVDVIELINPDTLKNLDFSTVYYMQFISPTSLDVEKLPIKTHKKTLLTMGYDLNEHSRIDLHHRVMYKNFSEASLVVIDNPVLSREVNQNFAYEGPVLFMPYGCQIQNFKNLSSPNKNVLGTNRSMSSIHNNSMILEAIALLEPTSYERFVFVQHGPESNKFMSRHENLLRTIPHEYMRGGNDDVTLRFLSKIDFYISASKSDGSSVSMLEAMSAGKICIVTNNETNRYWIKDGENGFCFDYNKYELSRKITEALSLSAEEKKRISLNAQLKVENEANWDKNSKKFLEIVQAV